MSVVPFSPDSATEIEAHPEPQPRKSAAVPLGIWLCAPALADEHGLPPLIAGLTRSLVTQAVTAFTRRGNTVAVTGPDAARIAAVADTVGDRRVLCVDPETVTVGGRRDRVGGGAQTPEPGSVDLLLAAELPAPWIDVDGEPYTTWARWLAPGGVLAVATRNPAGAGRFADHTGAVVTAATTAGLSYLQHIIAVLAHIQGERLLVSSPPASVTLLADAVHADAHTDLLVFHTDFGGAA
ncbi:hypothetical protein [Amycolatopsis pithecellobii]|uniref:Uncharacterized protein n=1 Tax=Amycolatopsis pithecellobii TaxID=664692 RepID=A0A6N7Z8M9_9PSEU|nr:hypothetical protein [Amycolatopsis pithecellobii]MTD58151.1 hypothetical protein [Amycolatopsis pithecellobii]